LGEKNLEIKSVPVHPGMKILNVIKHLNYKPWYALGEYIDNSLQSYFYNEKKLKKMNGNGYKLIVDISLIPSHNMIRITDNAGGIAFDDFLRAFQSANVPPDASGLNEFGMGMKSASIWFADKWQVRSTAIGEDIERTVRFDLETIEDKEVSGLDVANRQVPEKEHRTEIELENVNRFPRNHKTKEKIRKHLASIYRRFLEENILELYFDDEQIIYVKPKVLKAPIYNRNLAPINENEIEWKSGKFIIELSDTKKIEGEVLIRETGSATTNGFSLFRRGRLIFGSDEDVYRPQAIFGKPNSFTSQRLFGEFNLSGFQVTHTKDGIDWEEDYESQFINKLKEILANYSLKNEKVNFLNQCEFFRKRESFKSKDKQEKIKDLLVDELSKTNKIKIDEQIISQKEEPSNGSKKIIEVDKNTFEGEIDAGARGIYKFQVKLNYEDSGDPNWFRYTRQPDYSQPEPYILNVSINMLHKLFNDLEDNLDAIMPIIRITVTFCIAHQMTIKFQQGEVHIMDKMQELINITTFSHE
tara:strand:- start:4552 stop:6135 length:1584 start_codon:yes stop_codon:yes gene_type:complete